MGGKVAMLFAVTYPEFIDKLDFSKEDFTIYIKIINYGKAIKQNSKQRISR